MPLRRHAIAFLAILIGSLAVHAQVVGSLRVEVRDADGDALPGATVVLSSDRGYVGEEAVRTDRNGRATFPVLRVGPGYRVVVQAPGYATRRESGLTIRASQSTALSIELTREQVERVRVVASQPVVDLDDATVSTQFDEELIGDIPVQGRFYQGLLTLAPGVNDPDNDGNPIVHGSRARDFQANVSGISNVDPFSGQTAALINPNSIEAIEVITGGASVSLGRAQGGFANIVQKQGSNEFEGIFEFLYSSSDFGRGANDVSNVTEIDFESIQPSLGLSGPIVRDKLWFRLNEDYIDRETPLITGNGPIILPETRRLSSNQLTWQATARTKFQLQYSNDSSDNGNVGVSTLVAPETSFEFNRDVETWQVNWTTARSTRLLVDTVFATTAIDNDIGPQDPNARNDCLPNDPFFGNARCLNTITGFTTGPAPLTRDTSSERFTVRSQATWFAGGGRYGNHQIRVGINIENESYFQRDETRADISLFEFSVFVPFEKILLYEVNGTVTVPGVTELDATGNGWGIYLEDQYKPLSNLTITLGARLDRDEIYSVGSTPLDPAGELVTFTDRFVDCLRTAGVGGEGACSRIARTSSFTALEDVESFLTAIVDATGIIDPEFGGDVAQQAFFSRERRADALDVENTNVSPFFAIKWDPFRTGQTALSASYRRYYDKIFLNVPILESLGSTVNLTWDAFPSFLGEGFQLPFNRQPQQQLTPAPSVRAVDRNLRTPFQDEVIVAIEREIATETALRVEYVNRKYRDQLQDVDVNLGTGDFGRCRRPLVVNPATVVASNGTFYIDEETGEPVADNTPGPGDGVIDDCAGVVVARVPNPNSIFGGFVTLEAPDGIPDLYVQNPAFGSIFYLSNSNESDYEALVLTLTRRLYRSWSLLASYTYSESRGNGEDFDQAFGNDQSLVDDEFGFQSSDQRHFVRLTGTAITPGGIRLGATVRWQSGLPFSIQQTRLSRTQVPPGIFGSGRQISQTRTVFPTGVRNDQRNESYWTVDTRIAKEISAGKRVSLQLSAEVFNLLDNDFLRIYNDTLELGRQLNGINESTRDLGRRVQLGLRLAF